MEVTAREAGRNLGRLVDRVNFDHIALEIASKRGSAVLMAKDDFDSMVETIYLLGSLRNSQRLMSALESARRSTSRG